MIDWWCDMNVTIDIKGVWVGGEDNYCVHICSYFNKQQCNILREKTSRIDPDAALATGDESYNLSICDDFRDGLKYFPSQHN